MFIFLIRGRREREKQLGYVTDYCPLCRKLAPFAVMERSICRHLFFIPIGPGNLTGRSQICSGCGIERRCHLGQFKGIQRSARGPVENLIQTTFPNAREHYRAELEIAERIAAGGDGIDSKLRAQLQMQIFSMAQSAIQSGSRHLGKGTLALGLRPLSPTVEEIQSCLQRYYGTGIGAVTPETVVVWVYPEREIKDPNRYSY